MDWGEGPLGGPPEISVRDVSKDERTWSEKELTNGHGSKSRSPSQQPNPTTKIGSKVGGAPTPK